jgi:hypothetical protein
MKSKLLLLLPLAYLFMPKIAGAATASQPGITISPAYQQISLQANESEHPFQIQITNNKTVPQTLALSTADFNSLDETGGLFFIGSNPGAIEQKYGLAHWIDLPAQEVTLAPKETKTVSASIANLPSLAAGGHYGAIMLTVTDPSGPRKNRVTIEPITSSLLFVSKIGGDIYKLDLKNLTAGHGLFNLPDLAALNFKNEGNTHIIPRGVITVVDTKNQIAAKGIINDTSGIILPEKTRRYPVVLTAVANPSSVIHGRYELVANYRFDGFDQFRTYRQSFRVISPIVFLLALILLAAVIGIFYTIKQFSQHLSKR